MGGPQDLAECYVTAETLDAQTDGWLAEVRDCQWREMEPVRAGAIALLVVDMTRPFVDGGPLSSPNARAVVGRVAEAVDAFRQAQRPVLWLAQGHHSVEHDRGARLADWWPIPLLEGAGDTQPAAGLEPLPAEKLIVKRRYSGFCETDLDLTLRCLGVEQVLVCGALTNVCPYLTAFDAFMRGYGVYYAADGTASLNRAMHVAALRTVAGWCGHVVRVADVAAAL